MCGNEVKVVINQDREGSPGFEEHESSKRRMISSYAVKAKSYGVMKRSSPMRRGVKKYKCFFGRWCSRPRDICPPSPYRPLRSSGSEMTLPASGGP